MMPIDTAPFSIRFGDLDPNEHLYSDKTNGGGSFSLYTQVPWTCPNQQLDEILDSLTSLSCSIPDFAETSVQQKGADTPISDPLEPSPERTREQGTFNQVTTNESIPPKSQPSTWTSLFRDVKPQNPVNPGNSSSRKTITDPYSYDGNFNVYFRNFRPTLRRGVVRPKGLINFGNMCFMNAILQTLMFTNPFYHLLDELQVRCLKNTPSSNLTTFLTDAILLFFNEYQLIRDINCPCEPFSPEYVYDALSHADDSIKGRQEDAEEFLGFILDGMHEELVARVKDSTQESLNSSSDPDSTNWVEMGRSGKASGTLRQAERTESPITRIFGGMMRTVLKTGSGRSSIILEPFQTLQLHIHSKSVNSIQDAIKNLTACEMLDDFQHHGVSPSRGSSTVTTKQSFLETLPPILIIHLKRFVYDAAQGQVQKVSKFVQYPVLLTIPKEAMSPQSRNSALSANYSLYTVIYHHGKLSSGGHYTVDVCHEDRWLSIDDMTIEEISERQVTSSGGSTGSAYMLLYQRQF